MTKTSKSGTELKEAPDEIEVVHWEDKGIRSIDIIWRGEEWNEDEAWITASEESFIDLDWNL